MVAMEALGRCPASSRVPLIPTSLCRRTQSTQDLICLIHHFLKLSWRLCWLVRPSQHVLLWRLTAIYTCSINWICHGLRVSMTLERFLGVIEVGLVAAWACAALGQRLDWAA